MSLWQLMLEIASNIRAYRAMSLWQLMLEIGFQHQSLHADELVAAYSTESFQPQRLQQKELVRLKAFKPASSTRASQDQLDAWKSTRTSHSLNPTSLFSIVILMVSIFLSLPFSFLSNSFTDCGDLELAVASLECREKMYSRHSSLLRQPIRKTA